MAHEDRMIEAVARAINRASFGSHNLTDREEKESWEDFKLVRIEQARAAVAAYRAYDERR
jgi:hypothetical protein